MLPQQAKVSKTLEAMFKRWELLVASDEVSL